MQLLLKKTHLGLQTKNSTLTRSHAHYSARPRLNEAVNQQKINKRSPVLKFQLSGDLDRNARGLLKCSEHVYIAVCPPGTLNLLASL